MIADKLPQEKKWKIHRDNNICPAVRVFLEKIKGAGEMSGLDAIDLARKSYANGFKTGTKIIITALSKWMLSMSDEDTKRMDLFLKQIDEDIL